MRPLVPEHVVFSVEKTENKEKKRDSPSLIVLFAVIFVQLTKNTLFDVDYFVLYGIIIKDNGGESCLFLTEGSRR